MSAYIRFARCEGDLSFDTQHLFAPRNDKTAICGKKTTEPFYTDERVEVHAHTSLTKHALGSSLFAAGTLCETCLRLVKAA